eukprot:603254-Alexandrium_andersonii.AAC.2
MTGSWASYAEFRDADAARACLAAAGGEGAKFEEGLELAATVKPSKTQINTQRDWALRKAQELVKNHGGQRTVECDWKEQHLRTRNASRL